MAAKKSKKPAKKKVPAKKARAKAAPAKKSAARQAPATDVPAFFRLTVEVGNLDQAEEFYNKLFDTKGLRSPGARVG